MGEAAQAPLVRTRADLERISRNYGIPIEGLEQVVIVDQNGEHNVNSNSKNRD